MVIIHKIVSHEYFLDEMMITEIPIATKYIEYSEVASWVQTRQIMLASLRPYLKKRDLTPQEFMPLPIDEETNKYHTTEITNEEVEWYHKFKENFQ